MVLFSVLFQVSLIVSALGASLAGCTSPSASCKPDLASIQSARANETAHWVVDISTDPFYQSPNNLSAYSPGDTIRVERVTTALLHKYKIPPGLTLYRLMYQSTGLDGKFVPASAFILLPYTHPRKLANKPLNVIAWAHGTSGIERHCAPSIHDSLYYEYEAPFAMALQGYAVIAPDYAGQGTDTQFDYLAGPSHAADVAYAVIAARRSLPSGILSNDWVVVGHSEGGLTAWATNEREVNHPTPGFLGAVSIGPALANLEIISDNLKKSTGLGDTLLYPVYTLTTIAWLDRSIDVNNYFSKEGLERAKLAATGCFDTALASFKGLKFADVFKDQTWLTASWAKAWEKRTAVYGDKPLAKPMLIVEGLGDRSVPSAVVERTFGLQCKTHPTAQVHLSRYPDMDHDAVAFVSQLEYFDWIAERFNRVPPPSICNQATIEEVISNPPGGNEEEVSQDYSCFTYIRWILNLAPNLIPKIKSALNHPPG